MKLLTQTTAIYAQFGAALAYPHEGIGRQWGELRGMLEAGYPDAALKLDDWVQQFGACSQHALQEAYTRAFDLAPQAVPYLSVYLFGAENPQRGQFMAGLKGAYAAQGYDGGTDLPDHLAVILGYAHHAPAEEWREICANCLGAPIRLMRIALEEARNPYALLIASLETFVKEDGLGNQSDV